VIKDEKALGDVLVVTPQGLRPLPPDPSPQSLTALRRDALLWADRSLPIRTRTEYTLLPGGKTVRFTEHFKPDASGETIAPLPPLLAFAGQRGYPVRFLSPVITTNCRTWQGPYAFTRGSVVRYDLPVPPSTERGYIRAASDNADNGGGDTRRARRALLNDLVGHLGGDWATNAVDLGYAGMTNAQMAWAYLPPARRTELQAAWKRHLPLAFHLPPYRASDAKQPWKRETEPFTRKSYLWTYYIDGPQNLVTIWIGAMLCPCMACINTLSIAATGRSFGRIGQTCSAFTAISIWAMTGRG
jgi:hypothetical protein